MYSVVGIDASGNAGPASTLSVTTAACDATTPPPPTSSPPPPSTDTTAPTKPATVTASTRTATSIALTWQPSTDNVSVTGYGLYRGGSRVATVDHHDVDLQRSHLQYELHLGRRRSRRGGQPLRAGSGDGLDDRLRRHAGTDRPDGFESVQRHGDGRDTLVVGFHRQRRRDRLRRAQQRLEGRVGDHAVLDALRAFVRHVVHVCSRRVRRSGQSLPADTARYVDRGLPTTPPPSGVVELSGSVSPSTVAQKIAAAPSGPVTVRSASGGTATITGDVQLSRQNVTLDHLTVNGIVTFTSGASGSKFTNGASDGFDVRGADNVTVEGDTFDGKCQRAQNWVIEEPAGQVPNGTTIRNNTFRNYYMCSDSSVHTEALFIAYSDGGVIEGNTFEDNGTTAHVFFSYVGANGSLDTSDYARNWCVRGNTFRRAINPWYSIQFQTREPGVGEHERRPDFELVGSHARRPDHDRGRRAHEELLSVVADSVSDTRVACPVRGTQRVGHSP